MANYVNVSVERGIAARLPEGSLAALTYAFRLLHFPVNLLLMNATLVLLPSLGPRSSRVGWTLNGSRWRLIARPRGKPWASPSTGRSSSPYAGLSRAWGSRGCCVRWLSFQVWGW
jgi:hypothetical protein